MKILLLNQAFYPDTVATAQQLTGLAEELTARGHQVTVICEKRAYENRQVKYISEEIYKGVRILRVGSTGFGKKSFFHRLLDALTFEFLLIFRLLTLEKQDYVVSFTSPPLIGVLGVWFCRLKGGKCAQWLMDINPASAIAVGYLDESSRKAKFLKKVFQYTLDQSDKIIVLDRWMGSFVEKHSVPNQKVVTIPPWPAAKPLTRTGSGVLAELGVEDKFVLLFSGNHSIVHPLNTALEAALLLKDDPNFVFFFVGSGLRVAEVTQFARSHSLKNIVQLPFQTKEKYQELMGAVGAHLVVMGEKMSGLVHVSKIYGVLSSGRPVLFLGPKKSHVVDLFSSGVVGEQVSHGDPTGFVTALRRLSALSPAAQKECETVNRNYLRDNYGLSSSVNIFCSKVLEIPTQPIDREHSVEAGLSTSPL